MKTAAAALPSEVLRLAQHYVASEFVNKAPHGEWMMEGIYYAKQAIGGSAAGAHWFLMKACGKNVAHHEDELWAVSADPMSEMVELLEIAAEFAELEGE